MHLAPFIDLLVRARRFAAVVAVVCVLLAHFGMDVTAIAAVVGLLSLAIVLAARDTIADIIAGIAGGSGSIRVPRGSQKSDEASPNYSVEEFSSLIRLDSREKLKELPFKTENRLSFLLKAVRVRFVVLGLLFESETLFLGCFAYASVGTRNSQLQSTQITEITGKPREYRRRSRP